MNTHRIRRYVEELWDDSIVPELAEYVRNPNKSPHYPRMPLVAPRECGSDTEP